MPVQSPRTSKHEMIVLGIDPGLAASQRGCRVCGIPPRSVKLALTGSGAADKSQIERGLRRMLGISEPVKPDHAADALGLAYVGAVRE